MSSQFRKGVAVLVSMLPALVSGAAETATPQRLPGQESNRMVCILTAGKDFTYVNMPGHWDLGSPSISPDGKTVAFDALTIGTDPVRETWLVGIDGKGLRKAVNAAVPRWSPDGKRLLITDIVAAKDDAATRSHFLVEFDPATGKERRICGGRLGDWSPDGSQIVFTRGGEGDSDAAVHRRATLFVAKSDGSDSRELGSGDWASWSPDGRKIAYCVQEERYPAALWILELATQKREMLGFGCYRAQWASDGQSVVSNGLKLAEDGLRLARSPARFWLDKSRLEFFLMDLDNPWSPCVSRDGKTTVLIVDSERRKPT